MLLLHGGADSLHCLPLVMIVSTTTTTILFPSVSRFVSRTVANLWVQHYWGVDLEQAHSLGNFHSQAGVGIFPRSGFLSATFVILYRQGLWFLVEKYVESLNTKRGWESFRYLCRRSGFLSHDSIIVVVRHRGREFFQWRTWEAEESSFLLYLVRKIVTHFRHSSRETEKNVLRTFLRDPGTRRISSIDRPISFVKGDASVWTARCV